MKVPDVVPDIIPDVAPSVVPHGIPRIHPSLKSGNSYILVDNSRETNKKAPPSRTCTNPER